MGLFDFLFGKKKQDPSFTLGKEEAESICMLGVSDVIGVDDIAVMKAYGMIKKVDGKDTFLTESETVARLFEMYQELTEKK